MTFLILIFTILFFVLCWRRLDWAVMILIVALPSYLIRFDILGLPSTLLETMILAVFTAWFLKSYRPIFENFKLKIASWRLSTPGGKFNHRYPFDWEIILLLLAALAAAGVSGFSASSLGIWKAYFFEPVLFFIVVVNVMSEKSPYPPLQGGQKQSPLPPFIKGAELILWPLAFSALLVSALAIWQKITGGLIDNPVWAAAETRRVVSFFGYPNAVGLYLGPLALVMTGWLTALSFPKATYSPWAGGCRPACRQAGNPGVGSINMVLDSRLPSPERFAQAGRRGNDKGEGTNRPDSIKIIFISLIIIASVLSIYFAKSKGALLGLAAGLAVFGLLAGKKTRLATIVVSLIFGAGVMAYQPAKEAAIRNITLTNLSGQIRQAGWSDAWKMLVDGRLITGAGLANYRAAVALYHTEGIFIKDYSDPEAQRKLVFNQAYRTAHWQPLEIYLYPHNIVLNFWSELGLAGLLLFIWIIGKYFWMGICVLLGQKVSSFCHPRASVSETRGSIKARRWVIWIPACLRRSASRRQACAGMTEGKESLAITEKFINIGLISAMVAIIVHGLVDVPYFKNDLAVMFWLLLAMMGAINLESKILIKN